MAIRLVMVTHAPTAATRAAIFPQDEALDGRGAETAASARGTLGRFDRLLRGPERRCAETAGALGLDALAHPSLADLDVGRWRGRTPPETELAAWLTDPRAVPHGGESLSALAERVSGWLAEVAATGRGRVGAVTHPAVVRAAVLHALAAPPSCFWGLDAAPLTQTWLTCHDGRWRLRETGHALTSP